jgi:hypothetical protein
MAVSSRFREIHCFLGAAALKPGPCRDVRDQLGKPYAVERELFL